MKRMFTYGRKSICCGQCGKLLTVDHRKMFVFYFFLNLVSTVLGLSFGFAGRDPRILILFAAFIMVMVVLYPTVLKLKIRSTQ